MNQEDAYADLTIGELDELRRRIADLEALITVFIRKGQYHMHQWPDDKEMEHTLEEARAVVGKVKP